MEVQVRLRLRNGTRGQLMAFGDIDACEECLFGVDGPSQTCDECELGDCYVPAEDSLVRDAKFQRYLMTEAA